MKIFYIVNIAGLYMLMVMGTRPFVTLFANELGASVITIGFITSLFSLFPLFFAIYLGKRVDKLNSKTTLLIGGYLGVLGILLPGIFQGFIGLCISQIITGSAQTVLILSAQDYVGRISTKESRNKYVGWFSFGVALGSLLGPLLGGIISDNSSFQTTFFSMAVFGLLSCIIITIIPNEFPETINDYSPPHPSKSAISDLLGIKELRVALIFSLLVLFARDLYQTFFPLLALEFGYSHATIGIVFSIHGLASVIIRFYLSTLIKWLGSHKLFLSSMFICGILFIFLPFISNLFLAIIIAFLLGMSVGIGQPLTISLTIESAIQGRVAEALGIRLTVNRLTQIITPITFGALANIIGLVSIFLISSIAILFGCTILSRSANTTTEDGKENNISQ